MKKTYTTTYCEWNSYGSILQALALQQTLIKKGIQNIILKDASPPNSKYNLPKLNGFNIITIIKWIFNCVIKIKTSKKYRKNLDFISRNINIEYGESYNKILKNPPKADFFIAGSDQIWHPDLCKPFFFLDFVKDGTKRISYAASMGKTSVSPEKKSEFARLIKNFDAISVREEDNANVISTYTDKEIAVNIDPTFLITKEEWRRYEKEYSIKYRYILVYSIYWDEKLNKEVKKLSRETGLRVISISAGLDKVFAHKKLYDVGVDEFLWLIDHAEYVITSSFHGVAFSTIFNKKYSAVVNPKLPSRIRNLFEMLSVPIISIDELSDMVFDYELINENMRLEKEKSLNFLTKELEFEK